MMGKAWHTAGPWRFKDGLIRAGFNPDKGPRVVVADPYCESLAGLGPGMEANANAALIAAAPDLLEACERLVGDHLCDCGTCPYCEGGGAIAKAKEFSS